MSSNSPEQVSELQPIVAGNNLAYVRHVYLGPHSRFLRVEAERPDGTIAKFGDMNSSGEDGAREHFQMSDEAFEAKAGRELVYWGVANVMQLEKWDDPEFDNYITLSPPTGDWEPEEPSQELDLVQQGLRGALSGLALRRSVRELNKRFNDRGGVAGANAVLEHDTKIAVGLQGPNPSDASIIKLVGFETYKYTDPVSGALETGPRAIVEDREEQRGLRPVEYRIERPFIKQY